MPSVMTLLRTSFELRDGLKFSDGSPLTALDVKWSWERAFLRANGYGRANDVFGSIVGADTMKGTDNTLSGIQALDDEAIGGATEEPAIRFHVPAGGPGGIGS